MGKAAEAARRHVEAFNAHDIEAHLANESDEIEWVQPGGISLRGRDQVRQTQLILWEAIPDATVIPVAQVESGDTVVTEATLAGTHTGTLRTPAGDMPPSGARISLRFVTIQRVDDAGKVRSEHLYFDQLEFLTQLGAVPAGR